MEKEKILERIEEIINISKQKETSPPVELVLHKDGNYIYKELYEEYENLIKLKHDKKISSDEEKSKYEQLKYIEDKMNFMKSNAKNSKDKICILENDLEEYNDCLKLYKELYSELSDVIDYIDMPEENPEETIEKTVQLPIMLNPRITIEDNIEMENKETIDNNINIDNEKEQENVPMDNSRLLQDLADIDKILGSLDIKKVNNSFKIGDIVSPIIDTKSYNDENTIAKKDELFRVISYVTLDNTNKVVNSINVFNTDFEQYCEENKNLTNLFVISSTSKDKNVGSFKEKENFIVKE